MHHVLRKTGHDPVCAQATAFSVTNIALCKYWGKRCLELNLPLTSSLSIALKGFGAWTTVTCSSIDRVELNGSEVARNSVFYRRVFDFVSLFRVKTQPKLLIQTKLNIPVEAGLASSACGYAALTQALNTFFGWGASQQECSLLARLGSGSATRSFWDGLVLWNRGQRADGLDSYAQPLPYQFPTLRIGLHLVDTSSKKISSRQAMQLTVKDSRLYRSWQACVDQDLQHMLQACQDQNLRRLLALSERNARAMHATMMDLPEAIVYSNAQTWAAWAKIAQLRAEGVPLYATQDAGPNLKLLFEEHWQPIIEPLFPKLQVLKPFA